MFLSTGTSATFLNDTYAVIALVLVDRNTGNVVTVAFWDSKEDMMATEESGLTKEWIGKFNEYFIKPPTVERYEVSAQS